LSPFILQYLDALRATFTGSGLTVGYWVNSGSEANDLALRLARAATGKRGVITVDGAYHGHVTSIIDISPYKYAREGGKGRRNWVRCAPIPDVFSGVHRGDIEDDAMGAAYAADVQHLLDSLNRAEAREKMRRETWAAKRASASHSGTSSMPSYLQDQDASDDEFDEDHLSAGCGAFIMESVLSCGGQVVPPAGYLRRVYAAVRAAGGVCIADEVQVGFGRVGEKFWAFELQGPDVMPDILTLGKPLGNGFPVALVLTTPKIAAAFSNGMEYFNTFGGNPVAGRVACAVLAALVKEKMQANALHVGKSLLKGFRALQAKYPVVGSVRGVGLMVGLEILKPCEGSKDKDSREPWAEGASAIVYAMRKRRILLSTDGMFYNIIKLKPPMVFSQDNAKLVLLNLDDIMADLQTHIAAYHAL
jgi:ethanolamine-phosphate phospho-lyase